MKTKFLKTLILGLAFLSVKPAFSTHILNGHLDVKMLSQNSDSVTYLVVLKIKGACEPNAIYLPNKMDVCAYDAKSGAILKSTGLPLFSKQKFTNCIGSCVTEFEYAANVIVPLADQYIFKANICCRKELSNLRNDVSNIPFLGSTIYTKTARNFDVNTDMPDLINLNPNKSDTFKYYLDVFGADSFSIIPTSPLIGGSPENNFPGCSNDASNVEMSAIDYNSGYSYFYPMGLNGIFQINLSDSSFVLKAPNKGEYVIAYKLAFFKNSILQYETVREIEVVVSDYVLDAGNYVTLSAKANPLPVAELAWDLCPTKLNDVILQRSDTVVTKFQTIAGIGLSNYTYLDYSVNYGSIYYYRLVLLKGKDSIFSDTVKVTFFNKSIHDMRNDELKISPNPFSHQLNIHGQIPIQKIEIFNINGQSVYNQYLNEASVDLELDTKDLPSGIYIIESTNSEGWKYHHKVVKY